MKKILSNVFCILAMAILSASATTYTDATGDFSDAWGDITSVDVNNNGTTLTFKINTAVDPTTADWHHFYIGISTGGTGPGGNLNTTGYGRDIQMSTDGMDFALTSYPFYGGYDRFVTTTAPTMTFSGTGTATWDATGVTITALLSDLGLSAGNEICFDVWSSTSAGITVLDALSDITVRGYNNDPFDTGANCLDYTVAVPEPASCALLGIGAMLVLVRRGFRRVV